MTHIDHSKCTHPRTPAGRADCRRETYLRDMGIDTSKNRDTGSRGVAIVKDEWSPATVSTPRTAKRRGGATGPRQITDVASLPMPRLTPAQLASPVFQSLLRHRKG